MEKDFQRWTARRKVELLLQLIKGETKLVDACREHDRLVGERAERQQDDDRHQLFRTDLRRHERAHRSAGVRDHRCGIPERRAENREARRTGDGTAASAELRPDHALWRGQ